MLGGVRSAAAGMGLEWARAFLVFAPVSHTIMTNSDAFDQPPRRAASALNPDALAAWFLRYCPRGKLETRTQAALARFNHEIPPAIAR